MTPFDAVMAGVIVAGMVWGALRGITWQVASLASLVLGYAVAFPLSGQIAPHLPGQPIVARAVALLVAYVAVSGAIFGLAWAVRAVLRKLKFEAYDRHLGMLLGGAEGALLGSVVTLFVLSLAPSMRGPILASPSGRLLGAVMNRVEPLLPGEIRDELHPFWGEAPVAAARDDEWEDLKRPLESPREVAEPGRVAVGEPGRPAGEGRATAGRVAAGAIQEGVEYLAGPDGEGKTRPPGGSAGPWPGRWPTRSTAWASRPGPATPASGGSAGPWPT
jgi:membrane protein required for colicin V production